MRVRRAAEKLGDSGIRYLANELGYKPIFDGAKRGLAQGPDQVYRGADGVVHAFEAKGGSSQLGRAYGYAQGTPEWAVESAKQVLRSAKATPAERLGSEAILRAAAKGKLEVHVVRTSHDIGPVIEQTLRSTERSAKMAQTALSDLAKAAAQGADDVARGVSKVTKATASTAALKTTAKAAVVIGVAVDGTLRVEDAMKTEEQFARGEISQQQREVAHTKNAAGMAGGWAGAVAGAKIGGAAGAAAGSLIAPGPGTPIGAAVGGVAGGVAGYFGGEAAAEATAEWLTDQIHASGTTIKESAGDAWDWTTRMYRNGRKFVGVIE
ncbi:MAG TPA: hypothetical protein VFI31_11650 [Pirellulales bacterium]|nr:hypothetical protein [Pirellulales bacterium]